MTFRQYLRSALIFVPACVLGAVVLYAVLVVTFLPADKITEVWGAVTAKSVGELGYMIGGALLIGVIIHALASLSRHKANGAGS